MSERKFEVKERKKLETFTMIRAEEAASGRMLKFFLENATGDAFYPVNYDMGQNGITLVLEAKKKDSCAFPLAISIENTEEIREQLASAAATASAIRQLIYSEQARLRFLNKQNERG